MMKLKKKTCLCFCSSFIIHNSSLPRLLSTVYRLPVCSHFRAPNRVRRKERRPRRLPPPLGWPFLGSQNGFEMGSVQKHYPLFSITQRLRTCKNHRPSAHRAERRSARFPVYLAPILVYGRRRVERRSISAAALPSIPDCQWPSPVAAVSPPPIWPSPRA